MDSQRPSGTIGQRKSVLPGPQQPASAGMVDQLQDLSSLSSELWREVDFERLINRFVEQLNRRIDTTRACLFDYQLTPQGDLQLTPSTVKVRRERHLPRELQEMVIPRLRSELVTKSDNTDGMLSLKVEGLDFGLVMLGDAQIHRWLLIVRIEATEATPFKSACVDFLSRQLQYAAVWSCRLDNTQSQLYRDDLTGLYNRRYMEEVLEKEVRRAIRFGTRFCVFFVDLDNLKDVNDRHGHLTGSSVLKQFADILRVQLREVDSIIRYGGDEYIVLLLGANAEVGAVVAERLRKRIEDHAFVTESGIVLKLTCSIGIAAFPEHGNTKDELLKIADDSMYRGKRAGKNRVIIATQDLAINSAQSKRTEP